MSIQVSLPKSVDSQTPCPQPQLDEHRLGELAARWKSHELDGMALRHATGQFLIDSFGDCSTRQTYGGQVMKNVSEALAVSVSELSRMRMFADYCPDLEQFREQYPDRDTWTKVKAMLPSLAPNSWERQNQQPKTKSRTSEDIRLSVTKLQTMLADFDPNKAKKSKKLRKDLAALRQLIDSFLQALSVDASPQAPA